MANVKGKEASVALNDALQSGVHDAMDRVAKLKLDPCKTLVDQIANDTWNSWDESDENAKVCDNDGIDGNGLDEPVEPLAA
jgi:hypothetical protein